jgi:hypothetical protein
VVEQSINESSQEPLQQGEQAPGGTTAYEISRLENNANTVLGLFLQMIAKHVKDFGKLRMGDIIQYMTLGQVTSIEDDALMTYKSFMLGSTPSKTKNRKIYFDATMKDEYSDEEYLESSYELLQQEHDAGDDIAIYRVNPMIFRELEFKVSVSPDVLNPRSEDLERAMSLELFDRAITSPVANQEEVFKILLSTNKVTKRNPERYIMQTPFPEQTMQQQGGGLPASGNSPLASVMNKNPVGVGSQTPLPTIQ